ncbi:hypothetical protein KBD59_04435 [Candidatus Gracilibacteria bacterium]|nr:hypothetical protein [Candidatus Gracilibacteria bacterium]
MQKQKNKQKRALVFRMLSMTLVAIFFLSSIPITQAVGITPSKIVFKNILPSSVVKRSLSFVRSDAAEEEYLQITVKGEIGDMIDTSLMGTKVKLEKGVQTFQYFFNIKPGNVADGEYSGTIVVEQIEEVSDKDVHDVQEGEARVKTGAAKSGSITKSAAEAVVILRVSNKQLVKWKIDSSTMNQVEEKQPVNFSLLFSNEGNAATKPTKTVITLSERKNRKKTYTETISFKDIKPIPAFTHAEIPVVTKIKLPVGFYYYSITVYNKTKIVYKSDSKLLQVVPEGTLAQKGEQVTFEMDKTNGEYETGEIIKFLSTFKNTGPVILRPTWVIEIYKDTKRIDLLKKEISLITAGAVADLENEFTVREGGSYRAVSYYTYGITRTEPKEVNFGIGAIKDSYIFMILGFMSLATIALLTLFIRQHRKNKNLSTENIVPPQSK